ncbi:hypothetical protein [Shivajiella indica]|uniref:DUF3575 domain-containing protein n=1 Tax=Shivajiella indica TaxID=872115 RepID=A0ABW5B5K9_9BACT
MKTISLFPLLFLVLFGVYGQDSIPKKDLKNTVRLNMSSPLLFGDRFLALGYERVLNEKRSFSINVGRFSLPELRRINTEEFEVLDNRTVKESGFHIVGDYRFYLLKENKHKAPRGVYIGPYAMYNYLNRDVRWNVVYDEVTSNMDFNLRLNNTIVGFQLGYQFIFWKRFTLDLVLAGPGYGWYDLKTNIKTDLDPEQQQAFFDALNEAISGRVPGFEGIIEPGEIKRTGGFKTTNFGFRYVANFGFRF